MKTFIFNILSICLITSLGFSQSSCSKYYPLTEGTIFQYSNYDKKGKISGTIDYIITNYRKEGGLEIATMKVNSKDKKEKDLVDFYYDISCDGTGISIDFKSLGNLGMLKQFEDMKPEFSGTNMVIPNELFIGQKLPDASMNMKITLEISLEINIEIINRKIIGKEKITTPAGTFNCYVLQATTVMNMMGRNMTSISKSWFAEGVGMVKHASKGQGGEMDRISVLTKFNN